MINKAIAPRYRQFSYIPSNEDTPKGNKSNKPRLSFKEVCLLGDSHMLHVSGLMREIVSPGTTVCENVSETPVC